MIDTLTVGSLFSGIGGLDRGLERAGMEVIWQVENDDYCTKILNKHWPHVPVYGNITEVDFSRVRESDLICGGFPCQDISLAGKGEGIEGARSGLWWEMHRAIRVLRPRYAVIENVPALTHRGLDAVLGSLAEIRYDAEWQIISAAAMGAPHIRERIFIVAYPQEQPGDGGGHRKHSGAGREVPSQTRASGSKMADTSGERLTKRGEPRRDESEERVAGGGEEGREKEVEHPNGQRCGHASRRREAVSEPSGRRSSARHPWQTKPAVGRVDNGIPDRVDRLRGLGNAVVPAVAEFVGRHVMRHARETRHLA